MRLILRVRVCSSLIRLHTVSLCTHGRGDMIRLAQSNTFLQFQQLNDNKEQSDPPRVTTKYWRLTLAFVAPAIRRRATKSCANIVHVERQKKVNWSSFDIRWFTCLCSCHSSPAPGVHLDGVNTCPRDRFLMLFTGMPSLWDGSDLLRVISDEKQLDLQSLMTGNWSSYET